MEETYPQINVMVKINGKTFRCEYQESSWQGPCTGNVFTKLNKDTYKCNACGTQYKGE